MNAVTELYSEIDDWENQFNFAYEQNALKVKPGSTKWYLDTLRQHIHLFEAWYNYEKDPKNVPFPSEVVNNTIFNFTDHIMDDIDSFLVSYIESFMGPIQNFSRNIAENFSLPSSFNSSLTSPILSKKL